MNCFECRQALDAQPKHLSDAAREHISMCENCRSLAMQHRNQEQAWRESLQVAVPDGLQDRILLRTRYQRRTRTLPALAAAILVCALSIGLFFKLPSDAMLSSEMAHHVADEPHLWQEKQPPRQAAVATRIASLGGTLKGELPSVLLESCDVPGGEGAHLVLATENGRVVMTLMPNHPAGPEDTEEAGIHSLIRPAASGSYSLVGKDKSAVQQVENLLRSRVDWRV